MAFLGYRGAIVRLWNGDLAGVLGKSFEVVARVKTFSKAS